MRKGSKGRPPGQVVESVQYTFVPNHRSTMQALARARFTNQEYRVIIALMNQTNGYWRERDEISSSFWQSLTGMSIESLAPVIKKLISEGVVGVEQIETKTFYFLKNPNDWPDTVFAPQRISAKSIAQMEKFRLLLMEWDRDPTRYQWLKTLIKNASQPPSKTASDHHRSKWGNQRRNASQPPSVASQPPSVASQPPSVASQPPSKMASKSPLKNTKKEHKERTQRKNPVAPSRSRGRESTTPKPFQQVAGAFLDWVSSRENVKFPNRAKLRGIVRGTLVATEAKLEELKVWYEWVKTNDPYWGAKEPPVIIGRAPEKFPTWLRDQREGRGPPPAARPRRPGHVPDDDELDEQERRLGIRR